MRARRLRPCERAVCEQSYSRAVPRPRIERDEPIDPLATKLPRSLIKRLRVRARQDDISVQDLVAAAISRELNRRERLEARRTNRLT